jgi:starch phosphorylase
MVAIGLFYSQGYFYQRFTEDGWQVEDYLPQDLDDYPLETVKDENGYTLTVDVQLGDKTVKVRAWRLKVGRRSLLLLDTNFNENHDMADRMISYHLYGGDQDTRIKQELVLAMGGYKILRAIGIKPSILHLNEGHSAFALLAQAAEIMHTKGTDFQSAVAESRKNILFTNHTLKQAGNDVFPYALVEKYLGVYAKQMNVDFRQIFSLGVDPLYAEGKFGMTILGLNNSARVNAVSKIHAQAAIKIWPDHPMVPVTNGVHLSTWISEPLNNLLDEYVGERWAEQGSQINWDKVMQIPNDKVWWAHLEAKRNLIKQIKENCNIEIPDNALILGWFRRVTAYKQPEILTLDLGKLQELVSSSDRPVRFVFGGKAHPQDVEGKEILKQLYKIAERPEFKDKLILIPDYNWRMARYLYAGCDVWINSPIRYQEACGTSGMKAGANGALQFSTIDGWIDEIKDTGLVWEIEDNLNPEQYYSQLQQQIIPLFWERTDDIPHKWVERMKGTIQVILRDYGTTRMLRDYIEKLYRPILREVSLDES